MSKILILDTETMGLKTDSEILQIDLDGNILIFVMGFAVILPNTSYRFSVQEMICNA